MDTTYPNLQPHENSSDVRPVQKQGLGEGRGI